MGRRKYGTPEEAAAARLERQARYMRERYDSAAYVLPHVTLNAAQEKALRDLMKAADVGPSDAVRNALISAAAGLRHKVRS